MSPKARSQSTSLRNFRKTGGELRPEFRGNFASFSRLKNMAVSKVFTTFRGDVMFFSLLNTGSNDENCIEVQIFGFSKSSRSFTRTAKQLLPLGILGHELELVSAKCLMNSTTRMYQPGLSITYLTFFHGSCICMLSQSFPLFSQTCH